jgi:16S rRNA (cytosine967-C5)-methyltransferase
MPTLNTRAIAATILTKIFTHHINLNNAIENSAINHLKSQDRAFVYELCYGVMRWFWQLDAILNKLLSKPLDKKEKTLHALLLIGLYQIHHLKTPPHAAIHETVQAARELKKPWATGLVNGVLRQWQRNEAEIMNKIKENSQAYYSHPDWLLNLIESSWPQDAKNIFLTNNQYPPMTLRVNLLKQNRENYLEELSRHSIHARKDSYTQTGIILDNPQEVTSLPRFTEGSISIQNSSAQLAVSLLKLSPHMRVLDACAAPGGKTCHILETEPDIEQLIAIDNDERRLKKIIENFNRLEINFVTQNSDKEKIILLTADAAAPEHWWDGKLFDRILLDAPCSATGVIRRHPDIKFLRKQEDIPTLASQQLQLLQALWPLLKAGGLLLYATCSTFPQENSQVLQKFLAETPDAKEDIIDAVWGIPTNPGRQILPDKEMDGFFYGRLLKCPLQ